MIESVYICFFKCFQNIILEEIMTKKNYNKPDFEMMSFETTDVVLSSGTIDVKDEIFGFNDPYGERI